MYIYISNWEPIGMPWLSHGIFHSYQTVLEDPRPLSCDDIGMSWGINSLPPVAILAQAIWAQAM